VKRPSVQLLHRYSIVKQEHDLGMTFEYLDLLLSERISAWVETKTSET